MTKLVHVAVGIIKNSDGLYCVSKRPQDKHMGGFWEFPGGKVEPGESTFDALRRELKEELSIDVEASEPYMDIKFDYPDKSVWLDIHLVEVFSGVAQGCEGQEVCWVSHETLMGLSFPDANKPILAKLQSEIAKA